MGRPSARSRGPSEPGPSRRSADTDWSRASAWRPVRRPCGRRSSRLGTATDRTSPRQASAPLSRAVLPARRRRPCSRRTMHSRRAMHSRRGNAISSGDALRSCPGSEVSRSRKAVSSGGKSAAGDMCVGKVVCCSREPRQRRRRCLATGKEPNPRSPGLSADCQCARLLRTSMSPFNAATPEARSKPRRAQVGQFVPVTVVIGVAPFGTMGASFWFHLPNTEATCSRGFFDPLLTERVVALSGR